jgi:ABC-type phosphate transport system substrate-binding protein
VVPVKVVIRPDASKAAKAFYETVLSMSPQAYRKHWDELQLAGRGVAPKGLASPEELAVAIAQTPGGIGFGLASEVWQIPNRAIKIIEVR